MNGARLVHVKCAAQRFDMGPPSPVPDVSPDPPSFDAFLRSLQEPGQAAPVLSARRFADGLEMDLQTLAGLAGVHRNTLSRAPGSAAVQRFLRDAVRIIRAASDVSGDVGRALFWYRNEPLQPFGYETPERLVAAGRTDDLLRYVVSLEAGPTG